MSTVIRPGDRVRVLRDRFIARVGYPLHYSMLMDEVENDPRTAAALKVLGVAHLSLDLQKAIAKARVEQRGFGGRQRQIIYEEPGGFGRWVGSKLEVYSKRVAKTGTYYPARGGYSTASAEYDYEPAGLADCKTHILLMTAAGEIEACDVELVR